MKKDKKWFIDKWTKERDKTDVHDSMYHFINEFIADVKELDEPEVLSQELPVVPKFIAEFIEDRKHVFVQTLQWVLHRAMGDRESDWFKEEYEWIRHNGETFARAWLDGYEVEEQKYVVPIDENHALCKFTNVVWGIYKESTDKLYLEDYFKFTEQEIKDYDERFWAFAVPVEETELF